MSPEPPNAIAIIDESALVRDLLTEGLAEAGFEIASASSDGGQALAMCSQRSVNVLVISSGVCSPAVRQTFPAVLSTGTRILCLCKSGDPALIGPILLAGSTGYLFQSDATLADVVTAVRSVAGGQAALHPAAASAVLHQWRNAREAYPTRAEEAEPRPIRALTARERDILTAMGTGLTTRAIASDLGLASKTVETHRARIFVKLGARNQAHAVAIAVQHDLLGDGWGRN